MTQTQVKQKADIKGNITAFFSKLSRGLMLPIAMLPVAGLFLGIGAGVENTIKQFMDSGTAAYDATIFLPHAISQIGDVIFGNLPTLFCLGVAIAFAEEAGVAVFAAFVGWLIFNATQSTMIWEKGAGVLTITDQFGTIFQTQGLMYNGELLTGITASQLSHYDLNELTIVLSDKMIGAGGMVIGSVTITDGMTVQAALDALDAAGEGANASVNLATDGTFKIFWYATVPGSVIGSNVGLTSMQTSVFGGITIGLFVAFLYNKFHQIQLPNVIGFFSGSRFVPIITFLTVPLWGIAFLAVWPIFGMGLDWFGATLSGMPAGIDSFIFGAVERSLIPFGLHHAFYTPLWYTSAGGQLLDESYNILAQGNQSIWFEMQSQGIPFGILPGVNVLMTGFDHAWSLDTANAVTIQGNDYWQITNADTGAIYYLTEGVNPGSYMQGKFPIMLFGLPAAGAAMIMAAKKENRQVAMSVIGAAALTSFLTGITEPIEFTFLFLAPYLYYGFHVWMAAFSFMFLDIMGSHIGMTFSGGIFDYFLFGLLPDLTKQGANSLWVLPIGALYVPIYYFVFYFAITKFDVKTPGRGEGEVAMVSKADYKAAKGGDATSAKAGKNDGGFLNDPEWTARADELLVKLGGLDNLKSIAACITRLRVTVNDPAVVDYDGIVAMGAKGTVGKGKAAQQHIFGSEADQFKRYFLNLKDAAKN